MNVLCLNLCDTAMDSTGLTGPWRNLRMVEVRSVPELLLFVRNGGTEVVVINCTAPSNRTDDILLELRRIDQNLPVIFSCKVAPTDDVIRLVRLGAWHVWTGEMEAERMMSGLVSAAQWRRESKRRPQTWEQEPWRRMLVGDSDGMMRLLDIIRLVAARRSSVLITGETGTGKEVVARAIHQAGGRGHLPFVAVNCSAIPANLIESELFGYVRGAFTGASQSHAGRFEQANGGTIFLDEIGDLPLELQAKLLRVVQEREVQRLGSSECIRLNVRVLAATNVDLEQAVAKRLFREDLYYRLNVVPLHVPPLRERSSDVRSLLEFFLDKVCAAEQVGRKRVLPNVIDRLAACPWPGNVRQLEHAVERAVVLSGDREWLEASDFRALQPSATSYSQHSGSSSAVTVSEEGLDFEDTVCRLEWSLIQQALVLSRGNKARAAELLRMKRTTLLARVRSLEVRRETEEMALTACA